MKTCRMCGNFTMNEDLFCSDYCRHNFSFINAERKRMEVD